MKRVVITGLGVLSPIGNNTNDFWHSLINGKSGAAMITKFDTEKFKTKFACELKNFDPLNYIEKSEARRYDLFTQYALIAVEEAVKHANIDFEKLNRNKIGVIWGSGNGGINTFQEQVMEYAKGDGTPRFNPFFIPKMIVDIASGVISIKYGLRGINFTTVSACATSNTALIDAFNYIRWGKADMIISGGSEAPINEVSVGGFNASKALSTNNDQAATASRPFDIHRDGFVMGEGAGANISADDIDYLNAHATSTPAGDVSELKAIERVFGRENKLNISATKSMTGHLLGAAGAIEAIACIKAIENDVIPPTINSIDIEPNFKDIFNLTLAQSVQRTVNYAMSNTFGFGGHIATTVFGKVGSRKL